MTLLGLTNYILSLTVDFGRAVYIRMHVAHTQTRTHVSTEQRVCQIAVRHSLELFPFHFAGY